VKDLKKPKKIDLLKMSKLYDAQYAGTNKSRDCTLIITEGDSARSFAISGLSTFDKEA
jgi:DNA topoisomerase-2